MRPVGTLRARERPEIQARKIRSAPPTNNPRCNSPGNFLECEKITETFLRNISLVEERQLPSEAATSAPSPSVITDPGGAVAALVYAEPLAHPPRASRAKSTSGQPRAPRGRSWRGNEDHDGSNRRAALVGPAAERPSTCGDAVRCASVIGAMTQRRAWMPPNTLRPWSSCGVGAHVEIAVSRHGQPLPKTPTASTDGDHRLRSRTIRVVHDVSIVMMRNNQQPTIDAIFDALATTAVRVRRVRMRRSLTHRVVSPKSPRPRPRRRRRSRRVVRRTARGDPDPAPEPPDDLSLGRLA